MLVKQDDVGDDHSKWFVSLEAIEMGDWKGQPLLLFVVCFDF